MAAVPDAIRRADELNRLRELPDTPARAAAAPTAPKVAGLPTERNDADPEADDATGSIMEPPPATIPIDIGETSSTELPEAATEEQPPVIGTLQRVKSRNESRIKRAPRQGTSQTETARPVRSFQADVRRAEAQAAADDRR